MVPHVSKSIHDSVRGKEPKKGPITYKRNFNCLFLPLKTLILLSTGNYSPDEHGIQKRQTRKKK